MEVELRQSEKPQELEDRLVLAEIDVGLYCQLCSAPVPYAACGRKTPCPGCGSPYPLGDCSDMAIN